uniref:PGG domain-containing protein n=1 Tax=Fagus sylvatica TaxID=28930 RepID=A0A2N9F4M7_FAGSY
MSKLNRDGVGRSLERILEKQPTEVQTVAAANTAEGNEMTQVALDRNDKERTEIIHRVADINFVVATIIASAAFSALNQVPGGFDDKVGGLVAPECVPGLVLSGRRFVL